MTEIEVGLECAYPRRGQPAIEKLGELGVVGTIAGAPLRD